MNIGRIQRLFKLKRQGQRDVILRTNRCWSDLQALYNKYPNTELETAYGWPLSSGRNWWAVDLSSTGQYQSLNLSTGTSNATTSSTTMQMQACRTTPHAPQPATIELTSSVFDAASQYAKVKKGETIPLTVTVKDVNGSPAANAAFTLSRGDGVSRSGLVKTSDSKRGDGRSRTGRTHANTCGHGAGH
nr:DUF823 domain-containing adhesin [Kluyvera intermedia]